jgi:hypothetical protein
MNAPPRTWKTLRALALLVVSACVGPERWRRPSDETLNQQYAAAVASTRTPRTSAISRELTALTPSTPGLVWKDGKILMGTWTQLRYFQDRQPGETFSLAVDSWLTAAPFMRQWCRSTGLKADDLQLRIAQRLGLPPRWPNDGFVEFWVDPRELFRPCPDPEIQDHECMVEISMDPPFQRIEGEPPWACSGSQVSAAFVDVEPSHLEWMCKTWRGNHGNAEPLQNFPWTALGYTYDWGSKNHVGPSEFLSRKGTQVVFHLRATNDAYCTAE